MPSYNKEIFKERGWEFGKYLKNRRMTDFRKWPFWTNAPLIDEKWGRATQTDVGRWRSSNTWSVKVKEREAALSVSETLKPPVRVNAKWPSQRHPSYLPALLIDLILFSSLIAVSELGFLILTWNLDFLLVSSLSLSRIRLVAKNLPQNGEQNLIF